jgi:uncharacterized protein
VSRPALLDVNVLIALFDADHVHHELSHDWFADNRADGWATCPLTENGFIRIFSNPAYAGGIARPREVAQRLNRFCSSGHHVFWPADISLLDDRLFNQAFPVGHTQLTDVYLLGLAKKMRGSFVTFDQHVPLGAIVDAARDHLVVIAEAEE